MKHHEGQHRIDIRLASSPKEAFMAFQQGDRTMSQNDTKQPDPLLASLPDTLLTFVEDQLSNNEVSSDEEMREHFIACGLNWAQAERALEYRGAYANLCFGAATPIRAGAAIRYTPSTDDFQLL